ncbi:hypothetical protein MPSEU_000939300 [Mayamaea pseudoterrestris]|nr:hypothetical protein MPSEU_000939300 [Mayamaea pseudoterrestris]
MLTVLYIMLLLAQIDAFVVNPFRCNRFQSVSKLHLGKAAAVTESPVEKYFNLEELEDSEKAVTEVFLNADRTVTVGETDGPLFAEASGTWSIDNENQQFEMTLRRTFTAGATSNQPTDMQEFSFSVERTFIGSMYMVGAKLAVEGSVHSMDEHGDTEVGYFEMIDVTTERNGWDKE